MKPTRTIVYKTIGETRLRLHLFEPKERRRTDSRPAIVFFFGGGWTGGTPGQFFPHCHYLASRGMMAFSAEYRVRSKHGVTPYECVTDGKSAVRWIREHAGELGIDPDRVAAGGGSAGGHVAACTGTVPGLDEPAEDLSISSRPNAMVLFNPAVLLDWERWKTDPKRLQSIKERFAGKDPTRISPAHYIAADLPPTIIFHGEADVTIPVTTVQQFGEAMRAAENRCDVLTYAGEGHGFFNLGRGNSEKFLETLKATDAFLVSLGYLEGPNTVAEFRD